MASTSLEKLFPNRAFIEVLLFFLLHPQEETYLARIARSTGKVLIQVQRTLKRLEEAGLVNKILRGNKAYYRANASHSVFNDLKKVIIRTIVFSEKLENELTSIKDKIIYGFIFGSIARNHDHPASDVDIFLIGNLTFEEAGNLTFPLSMELGKEVNTVIYSLKEFRNKIKEKHTFITEVIQNPKIWLFGNEHEFEKICGR
jgi:predicted nucleotidyltransferase